VNKIKPIEDYSEMMVKLLNYFTTFKYEFTNIENIYSLIKGLKTLSGFPILLADRKIFDYTEDKTLLIKYVNSFGKDITIYNVTLTYSLNEDTKEENKPLGDLDLEDEPVEAPAKKQLIANSEKGQSGANLDISSLIKTPGKYNLEISAKFTNNVQEINQKLKLELTSISKIKLNHIKMSVTHTQDKGDEKEITVEYPKRSFRNIKATQNSVIKLKVKLNYGDSQVYRIEQMFLRLRHTELGKAYSAYVGEYKSGDDYYYINFDMSESVK
jgi:hypothetical protein